MQESPIKAKPLLFALFASSLIVLMVFLIQFFDTHTKIVFCDVGQGDATYIRIKNKVNLFIDAWPNRKVLQCLGKYIPFWDKEIELAFITHRDSDHYGGFIDIVDRYKIGKFITIKSKSSSKTYELFEKKAKSRSILFDFYSAGDKIKILDSNILFFWPPKELKSSKDNEESLVFLFQEKDFKVIFTGDSTPAALQKLVSTNSVKDILQLKNVDVLKVPHHGSSLGLTSSFLKLADPKVAVISVGSNNPYGHPRRQILDLLEARNIEIKRTDKDGDIKFILKE